MKVDINQDGVNYNLSIEGRIDTTTADQFFAEISPLMKVAGANITIDCSNMSYTSSQGLRIFLMLQKSVKANGGNLVLTGMQPSVKEVFDITGFSYIITIK